MINTRFSELHCSNDKKKVKQNKKESCNCSAEQKLKFVEQSSQIAEQNKSLADQKTVISKLNTTLAKQAARIGDQNTRIAEYNATFEEQAARIGNKNTIIGHLNSSLDNQTTRLAEQAAQIADQNIIIEQLNKSLAKEIAKHKKGPSLGNIAFKKPAAQSPSTYYYSKHTADKAVDGNNIIDLLQEYSISTIIINVNTYRLVGFNVRLGLTGSCNQSGFNSATVCYTEPGVRNSLYSVKGCNDGRQMSGRYVFIGRRLSLVLHEVEIYSN